MTKVSKSLIACLITCSIQAISDTPIKINGKVMDLAGHYMQGVNVSLARAKQTTVSDANGDWSISAQISSISQRPNLKSPISTGKHVIIENGQLSVTIDGFNVLGNGVSLSNTTASVNGLGRTSAAVIDTILFAWNGNIRSKVPIEVYSISNLYSQIDTSSLWGVETDSRDGQSYKWVIIGTQKWQAQNLNYKTQNSWCYNNINDSCTKFGQLYAWADMLNLDTSCNHVFCSSQVQATTQGVCPTGWHIPSVGEWNTLLNYSNRDSAGLKLKSKSGWSAMQNGIDSYGFNTIPSGSMANKSVYGIYGVIPNSAYFWSKDEEISQFYAKDILFYAGMDSAQVSLNAKSYGFSVRCVK